MIAIVTGASSGLGACFCKAIDGRGFEELWIVARRAGRLEGLSDSLDTPCRIVTADLSTDDGIDAVTGMVSEESPTSGSWSTVPASAGSGLRRGCRQTRRVR